MNSEHRDTRADRSGSRVAVDQRLGILFDMHHLDCLFNYQSRAEVTTRPSVRLVLPNTSSAHLETHDSRVFENQFGCRFHLLEQGPV